MSASGTPTASFRRPRPMTFVVELVLQSTPPSRPPPCSGPSPCAPAPLLLVPTRLRGARPFCRYDAATELGGPNKAMLLELEAGYLASNPYHNATHAADVAYTIHMPRVGRTLKLKLNKLQLVAAVIAAAARLPPSGASSAAAAALTCLLPVANVRLHVPAAGFSVPHQAPTLGGGAPPINRSAHNPLAIDRNDKAVLESTLVEFFALIYSNDDS